MVKYIPNYYAILKIDEDADKNTIREAYEKLSKKYKQSSNQSKKSKQLCKFTNDAYIVLSDDKKRKKYDKILKEANQIKPNQVKKINKNTVKNAKDAVNFVQDNYDIISNIFKTGSKFMKGRTLFTGTNIIIGGAMAGYGVKKGRDYMAKRRGENNRNNPLY